MRKENKNKGTKRILPDVRHLTEEQLFQLRLTPEENFMPQEVKDYLKLAEKEVERRCALEQERKLKKRLERKFNKTSEIIDNKQGMLSFGF